MRSILVIIMLVFVLPMHSKAKETRTNLAVYVTGDINPGYKKVIGAKIVSRITTSNEYSAVERTADFLSTLTHEQDYQTSGVVSDTQIAKLGEQFGVQYVIIADASEIFGSIFVSGRMINVESAQIVASITCEGKVDSMESLVNLATELSDALIGELAYPGLLSSVEIRGPFNSTKDCEHLYMGRLYDIHTKERITDIKQIEYIAKSYKKKGVSCTPVLTLLSQTSESVGSRGENTNYFGTLVWSTTSTKSNVYLGSTLIILDPLSFTYRDLHQSFYIYIIPRK